MKNLKYGYIALLTLALLQFSCSPTEDIIAEKKLNASVPESEETGIYEELEYFINGVKTSDEKIIKQHLKNSYSIHNDFVTNQAHVSLKESDYLKYLNNNVELKAHLQDIKKEKSLDNKNKPSVLKLLDFNMNLPLWSGNEIVNKVRKVSLWYKSSSYLNSPYEEVGVFDGNSCANLNILAVHNMGAYNSSLPLKPYALRYITFIDNYNFHDVNQLTLRNSRNIDNGIVVFYSDINYTGRTYSSNIGPNEHRRLIFPFVPRSYRQIK